MSAKTSVMPGTPLSGQCVTSLAVAVRLALGLLLAVWVTAASVSDNAGGIRLLAQITTTSPHVTKGWADTGYRAKAIDHGARLGIDVEVVQREPGVKGFKVIPRRWVVERTSGWLMHHRRLARDCETHPHRSEAMISPGDDRPDKPPRHP